MNVRLVPHDYQVGQTLELVVERIAYGGDSIAYAPDGHCFFRGAAPKDISCVCFRFASDF